MSRHRPRGFSLIEIVAAVAILTILAALIIPSIAGYDNQRRTTATVTILKSLGTSLNNSNAMGDDYGFLQTVLRYPIRLSHLTVAITTADKQCSGAVYTAAMVSAWRSSPRYTSYNILPLQGVSTPLGWIQDTVVKGTQSGTFGSSPVGYVELHIDSLSTADVQAIDLAVDEVVDSSAGLVRDSTARGTATTANLHLLRFLIPAPLFRRSGATDSTTGCY
jgi:prepilin-type N-terminal cleavage/methylation domain-containing protein